MTLIHNATEYHGYGLQSTPAKWPEKSPLGPWKSLQDNLQTVEETQARFREHPAAVAMGFLTGAASGGLEVIDVDCKYDLTGNLYPELWRLIEGNLPELATKLPVIKTKSGGYHLYYRCAEIEGNKKLARRPTTPEEKGKNPNEKVVVLIETRGTGGFIVAPPTPGYTLESGSFDSIPAITSQERGQLLQICRSLNEYSDPEPDRQTRQSGSNGHATTGDIAPWDDYNQQGDVVSLLEQHGWTFVFRAGDRTHLKRPGSSTAKTSANFHEGLRKLMVHSSSTEFETERAYSPFDVFKVLRGITNNGEAAKELRAMGYGSASTYEPQQKYAKATTIRVEATDNNGETTNLNKDGVVNEEAAKGKSVDAMYVYFTESSDPAEIMATVKLLQRSGSAPVYLLKIADLSDTSQPIETLRPYEYMALRIIQQYADAVEATGEEGVPIEIEDKLIKEFVSEGVALTDPIERNAHRNLLLDFCRNNDLHQINADVLDAALEALRVDAQKETQRRALESLVKEIGELQQAGKVDAALTRAIDRSRELKTLTAAESFAQQNAPVTEADFDLWLGAVNPDIPTGYTIEGEALLLPTGAITIIAAPTNHGKSALLNNLALRTVASVPDKATYYLSYEESQTAVMLNVLNVYINEEVSKWNRRTMKSHAKGQDYFQPGKRSSYIEKKAQFFSEYITPARLSVQYRSDDSDTLCQYLRYLAKERNAGVVFIDYIQLLHKGIQGRNRYTSRQEEIKQICLDLKDVAVETGLALVLAAQFNRTVSNPSLLQVTNIREAADIEQIAALVLALWNNKHKITIDKEIDAASAVRGYDFGENQVFIEVLKHRGDLLGLREMFPINSNTGVITNKGLAFKESGSTTTSAGSNGREKRTVRI